MSITRYFLLAIVSSVLSAFMAVPCQAAPILLVEFRHNVAELEGGSVPATVLFDFEAYYTSGGTDFLSWEDGYGPMDVGMTFLAPPDIVDRANTSIVLPDFTFSLTTGPANFSDPLRFEAAPCGPSSCMQWFVPDLPQYTVTRVERIIDELQVHNVQGGFYALAATQRIRYWGTLVPEAGTLALLSIGMVHLLLSSRRRRPN